MTVCYPFIYEGGELCDYEIETDRLCSQIGFAIELLPQHSALNPGLRRVQELVYHQNGSVRGKLAISADDLRWLQTWCEELIRERGHPGTSGGRGIFVLPAGVPAACVLHEARCQAKTVVRILGRLRAAGMEVPDLLLEWSNVLANFLFLAAEKANREAGRSEIPFVSRSY